MSSQAVTPNSEAAILARLIESQDQRLAPEVARYLLSFAFQPRDIERMNQLAERAQAGELNEDERAELGSYLHVSNLLAVSNPKLANFWDPYHRTSSEPRPGSPSLGAQWKPMRVLQITSPLLSGALSNRSHYLEAASRRNGASQSGFIVPTLQRS